MTSHLAASGTCSSAGTTDMRHFELQHQRVSAPRGVAQCRGGTHPEVEPSKGCREGPVTGVTDSSASKGAGILYA